MRGITIRVNRVHAMRIIGESIRRKTADFEKDKREFPKKLASARKEITSRLKTRIRQASKADRKLLSEIAAEDIVPWRERSEIIPDVPELNVCREKQLLVMLQNDVRDVLPVNSNHDLWSVLQGKCEVKQ